MPRAVPFGSISLIFTGGSGLKHKFSYSMNDYFLLHKALLANISHFDVSVTIKKMLFSADNFPSNLFFHRDDPSSLRAFNKAIKEVCLNTKIIFKNKYLDLNPILECKLLTVRESLQS